MAEKKGLQILNQIVYIHRKLYSPKENQLDVKQKKNTRKL